MTVSTCCLVSVVLTDILETVVSACIQKKISAMQHNDPKSAEITIYTDGACSPNPGPGGWGAVVIRQDGGVSELSGASEHSTNNRMELTAAVMVLQSLERSPRIVLYTDSQYLKKGITEWIQVWQRNSWRTAGKKEVKNADLWLLLLEEIKRHDIVWKWVQGHGSNRWNIRADELAVAARKTQEKSVPHPPSSAHQDHIDLFTGVTCRHRAGVGAWAVILTWRNHTRVFGSRAEQMTANQLYLLAVISGLKGLKKPLPVHVHTHSGYLYEGATSWLAAWQQRAWQTSDGREVSNKALWQELARLLERYEVSFFLEDRDLPLCFMQEAKELAREFEQGI